jgi:hypothetical protein
MIASAFWATVSPRVDSATPTLNCSMRRAVRAMPRPSSTPASVAIGPELPRRSPQQSCRATGIWRHHGVRKPSAAVHATKYQRQAVGKRIGASSRLPSESRQLLQWPSREPPRRGRTLRRRHKPLPIGRANRPNRAACRGAARQTRRSIQNHLVNRRDPVGYTKQVGATPDGTSRMRSCSSGMPLKTASLCPFPFPYQIWFEGNAVRARTAKGLFHRGR